MSAHGSGAAGSSNDHQQQPTTSWWSRETCSTSWHQSRSEDQHWSWNSGGGWENHGQGSTPWGNRWMAEPGAGSLRNRMQHAIEDYEANWQTKQFEHMLDVQPMEDDDPEEDPIGY